MKKITLLSVLCVFAANTFAQKETFDLTTYMPPKGWEKEVTNNAVTFTIYDAKTKNWCRIGIIKSTNSKGSLEKDFASEWQELIVKNYNPAEAPQLNDVQEADGWKIKAGTVKFTFNNSNAMAILTTMSGFNRCVSIVATTNNQGYSRDIEALLSSLELKKPETTIQPVNNNNNSNTPIIGTWCISASDQSGLRVNNGVMNYIQRQYTLSANGTYTFITKTFDPFMDKILLGKENGTYQISGNMIIIIPQKSVLEAWSKNNGRDEWGHLINSQSITPEKQTYQFTKHYFSGIREWDLVLQAGNVTKRDGPFNGGTAFSNAWIYSPVSPSHPLIKLPD